MFKVPPKGFTLVLLKLHYILLNEGSFVDKIEFHQEDLIKIIL